ncbi:phospholipase D-like domain-containing protein [Sphingomonas cavernae]|uniref:Phospholipase D n=1 Tax=Sphingomonas cavernae TaxID=2320861 RepID=A0A418WRY4_9SPHN|nr:phosphatidylserine/phosphatidylglycerophosphate/cardiolipin synthase family protein [Sphingomonas cavernae]RJF93991.1 phosphatidylserine/phosphatidylglycerophosphate/cardiolipin synthase family protein [Sphingomonas cavernae]
MDDARPARREAPQEVDGHRLTPIVEGPARLKALLALIAGARERIRLYYYMFLPDSSGVAVREALLDAMNRGVRVSLIVDGFGSNTTPPGFFAPLNDAGCELCQFIPRYGRRYLLRNHQKIAIADDRTAIIGGFNIGDDYFAPPEAGKWHDLGLEVRGPAVGWLVTYYDILDRWVRSDNASFRALRRMLAEALPPAPGGPLRWLLGGPTRRLSPWARTVKHDLEHARRADMIEAYFSPSRSMFKRTRNVAKRGGTLRLITAQRSDNPATVGAARLLYGGLLKQGCEVYEYLPRMLHMKLMVIDDITYVGSANFDIRSLFLNMELMLRIEDAGFAAHMRAFFESELADCERITPELHNARATWLNRVRWALSWFVVNAMDYTVTRRLNFGLD